MRLRFVSGDDDEYNDVRESLLDKLDESLDLADRERAGLIGDVGSFLDWRYHHSRGVLDEFSASDVTEFLLEWCPRRVSRAADAANELCDAVVAYLDFMACTGRLVGGSHRAERLKKLIGNLVPSMREEMGNPANFGMAKSLLDGLDLSGLSENELQAALDARMNEFNALPFDERRALTDRFFDDEAEPDAGDEPYELPFVYIPPVPDEVAAAAAAAPLVTKVDAWWRPGSQIAPLPSGCN